LLGSGYKTVIRRDKLKVKIPEIETTSREDSFNGKPSETIRQTPLYEDEDIVRTV